MLYIYIPRLGVHVYCCCFLFKPVVELFFQSVVALLRLKDKNMGTRFSDGPLHFLYKQRAFPPKMTPLPGTSSSAQLISGGGGL